MSYERAKMRARTLLSILAVVVVTIGTAIVASGASSWRFPERTDNPTAQRGCVVRFDQLSASGNTVVPRIHSNSTHACVGVTSLAVDWSTGGTRGDLIVRNTGGEGTIVSLVVEEDESFAQRGIVCGGSGGGVETRIRCYDREGNKIPAYSLDLYGPYMNLWIGWTMWMDG